MSLDEPATKREIMEQHFIILGCASGLSSILLSHNNQYLFAGIFVLITGLTFSLYSALASSGLNRQFWHILGIDMGGGEPA